MDILVTIFDHFLDIFNHNMILFWPENGQKRKKIGQTIGSKPWNFVHVVFKGLLVVINRVGAISGRDLLAFCI